MTQLVYRCGCCDKEVRVNAEIDLKDKDIGEFLLRLINDRRTYPKISRTIVHKCNRYTTNEVGIANLVGIYSRDDNPQIFY